MRIRIIDARDMAKATVDGAPGLAVEVSGSEGIASRIDAPTYRLCTSDGDALCEVKRHFFSNMPFFTITFRDAKGSVKLSQEMSAFKICYSLQGNGLSYAGDFQKGDIDILQKKEKLGHLHAEVIEDGVSVDIQEGPTEPSTTLAGVALAYGLMLAYLRRPLHAADNA